MLYRSQVELETGDFTLSIILSAMAVECELSFLFFKWKRIDFKMAVPPQTTGIPNAETEKWSKEYRTSLSIKKKLDTVCFSLTDNKFDTFVAQGDPAAYMQRVHPESAGTLPSSFFERTLFWKRNEILHSGEVNFLASDASQCLKVAATLIVVTARMDSAKYDRVFGRGRPHTP